MPIFSRPLKDYAKVRALIGRCRRNRAWFLPQGRIESLRYLDLGCGPNISPAFINLDYDWKPGVDVVWDITQGLPFRSSSLEGIFTEHCLEHLTLAGTQQVLAEAWRILQPGGRIRIVVPDGELYLTSYGRHLAGEKETGMPYGETDRVGGWSTPILSVNRIFRAHNHLFIYDFETMRHLLADAGFSAIVKHGFGQGSEPLRERDSAHRRCESLYVEAIKAGATSS